MLRNDNGGRVFDFYATSKQINEEKKGPLFTTVQPEGGVLTVVAVVEPFVFLLDQNDKVMSEERLSIVDNYETTIRDFGVGSSDKAASLWLVDVEKYEIAGLWPDDLPVGRWKIEVGEQPSAADIELVIPADEEGDSEIRAYNPGQFQFPTISVDSLNDLEADRYTL